MARETIIVFVYDTVLGQKEENDPASALIYFHPTWVSVEQKTALCGQIIGTAQCVKNLFSKPEVVSLRNGNFFITEKGRFLFVVGTDRNVASSHLEFKAKTLYSLLEFLHEDFETLANSHINGTLTSKLSIIFDAYIKMLVYARSIFSQNSSLMLTKGSSNVFMDAFHVLDSCQELSGVLGGSLMYHNKVVATHLSSDLTNRLILIDPYRNKCSAEAAETIFSIPLGVQLLQVYISEEEYTKLIESSERARNTFHQLSIDNKKDKKKCDKDIKDTFLLNAMKRDQSLIFTAVPEDSSVTSEVPYIPTTKKNRPKFLNLKNVFGGNTTELKSKGAASTPLCGQTSVCSTPLKDIRKFVHQNPLKICYNEVESTKSVWLKELKKFEDFDRNTLCSNVNSNLNERKKYSSFSNISEIYNSIFDKKSIENSHILPNQSNSNRSFKTITDPTFPVFKRDGTIVSRLYYEERIVGDSNFLPNSSRIQNNHINEEHLNKLSSAARPTTASNGVSETSNASIEHFEYEAERNSPSLNKEFETPEKMVTYCHYSSGIPQTPLMSKLSMVPSEENIESSSNTTHCQKKSIIVLPHFNNKAKEITNSRCRRKSSLQKCILFVCGQRNIVLTMLLKEEAIKEKSTIKKLWDICTDRLSKLENDLRFSMESSNNIESEPYTYLQLDSEWHSLRRCGPWNESDLESLHYLHDDFNSDNNLTEILMRGSDNIIFGHHSGSAEVFYSESANFNAGLPPPVDPMGLIQIKAKKRLERDHKLILV